MRRLRVVFLSGLLVAWLIWWSYVPGRFNPSPVTEPNPTGETIDVCALLPAKAVQSLVGHDAVLRMTVEALPHYQTVVDQIAPSMYMSICHYKSRDECTEPTIQGREVTVGVSAMRNHELAIKRWKAGRGDLRGANIVWREDNVLQRPAYFFISSDGSSVYKIWDDRFLLAVAVTPCTYPGDAQSSESLTRRARILTESLRLPAEQFVSRPVKQ